MIDVLKYLWIKYQPIIIHLFFVIIGLGFMGYGLIILISAYQLDNPHYFIMFFFASNLFLLIGLVFFAGYIWRLFLFFKQKGNKERTEQIEDTPPFSNSDDRSD